MAGMNKEGDFRGDFGTPEQEIPHIGFPGVDWESCMTMNGSWGYKVSDNNWKSTDTLIRNLVDIASKGGNYLLNVGPTAEGLIPAPSIERLEEIGAWMAVNGESIHGTSASTLPELEWGRCTIKEGKGTTTYYLHVFDWPEDGKLVVPGLKGGAATMLDVGERLEVITTGGGCEIDLGSIRPDPIDGVIKVEIKQ